MKNKNVKRILIVVLIVIVIVGALYLANIIRKYAIIKELLKKEEAYSSYENAHFKMISTNLDDVDSTPRTSDIYINGAKYVMISEFDNDSGHNKTSLFIDEDKWSIFSETSATKTLQIIEQKENSEAPTNFYFEEFNDNGEIIIKAINSKVSTTQYNGKQCYIIKEGQREIYIDKDTGLVVKDIEGKHIQEFEREFNIEIDNAIFTKPNAEEYELIG